MPVERHEPQAPLLELEADEREVLRVRLGRPGEGNDGRQEVAQVIEGDHAGGGGVGAAGVDRHVVDRRQVGRERPLPQAEYVAPLALDELDRPVAEGPQGVVQRPALHGDVAGPKAARRQQAQLEEGLRRAAAGRAAAGHADADDHVSPQTHATLRLGDL